MIVPSTYLRVADRQTLGLLNSAPLVQSFGSIQFSERDRLQNHDLSQEETMSGIIQDLSIGSCVTLRENVPSNVADRGLYNPQSTAMDVSLNPSSANLNTASSLFTLDIPLAPKLVRSSGHTQRSPKSKRKNSKGSKSKEKKSRGKSKSEDSVNRREAAAQNGESVEGRNIEDLPACRSMEDLELYAELASKTKSVGRFNKLAYPDVYGHTPPPFKEPLHEKAFGVQRLVLCAYQWTCVCMLLIINAFAFI